MDVVHLQLMPSHLCRQSRGEVGQGKEVVVVVKAECAKQFSWSGIDWEFDLRKGMSLGDCTQNIGGVSLDSGLGEKEAR